MNCPLLLLFDEFFPPCPAIPEQLTKLKPRPQNKDEEIKGNNLGKIIWSRQEKKANEIIKEPTGDGGEKKTALILIGL
jgi:hypothetical protein